MDHFFHVVKFNGRFLLCSESLSAFIETDLLPSIKQLEQECKEAEERSSHIGEYVYIHEEYY